MISGDIAWQATDEVFGSPSVHFMNLDTGTKKEISSGEGEVLKPVGFIGRDLVVGISHCRQIFRALIPAILYLECFAGQQISGCGWKPPDPGSQTTDCCQQCNAGWNICLSAESSGMC